MIFCKGKQCYLGKKSFFTILQLYATLNFIPALRRIPKLTYCAQCHNCCTSELKAWGLASRKLLNLGCSVAFICCIIMFCVFPWLTFESCRLICSQQYGTNGLQIPMILTAVFFANPAN